MHVSDGQTLLLVVCVIYATESLLWLDRRSVAFTLWWGTKWSVSIASNTFGTSRGGLLLLNMFPPLGKLCSSYLWPISVSPQKIAAYNSQSLALGVPQGGSGVVFEISQVNAVACRDRELWLNGSLFCRFPTQKSAASMAALLNQLRQSQPAERSAIIEAFWAKRFDLIEAQRERETFEAGTKTLRRTCIVQFIYIFVVLPCLMGYFGMGPLLVPAALIMVVVAAAVSIIYFRVHARFYPIEGGDRISHGIKMALCPPASIRAVDLIASHAHSSQDCLTWGCLLLCGERQKAFIGRILRDIRYPLFAPDLSNETVEVCKWQNSVIETIASKHLPSVAEYAPTIDNEPAQRDQNTQSFCPRCRIQLSISPGKAECPDCPGIQLKPFFDKSARQHPGP